VAQSRELLLSANQLGVDDSTNSCIKFTEVFCWGVDTFGQLGMESSNMDKKEKPNSYKLPRSCSFNILVKSVSCGEHHSAILTNQSHLYMVGSNSMGQLGIADLPI